MKLYALTMDVKGEFETRVTGALEQRADVVVPADFAARVVAKLPALKPARRRMSAANLMTAIAVVVSIVVLLMLAPHAMPNFASVAFDIELLVLLQMAAIATWFSLGRGIRS